MAAVFGLKHSTKGAFTLYTGVDLKSFSKCFHASTSQKMKRKTVYEQIAHELSALGIVAAVSYKERI